MPLAWSEEDWENAREQLVKLRQYLCILRRKFNLPSGLNQPDHHDVYLELAPSIRGDVMPSYATPLSTKHRCTVPFHKVPSSTHDKNSGPLSTSHQAPVGKKEKATVIPTVPTSGTDNAYNNPPNHRRKSLRFDAPVRTDDCVESSSGPIIEYERCSESPHRHIFFNRRCFRNLVPPIEPGQRTVFRVTRRPRWTATLPIDLFSTASHKSCTETANYRRSFHCEAESGKAESGEADVSLASFEPRTPQSAIGRCDCGAASFSLGAVLSHFDIFLGFPKRLLLGTAVQFLHKFLKNQRSPEPSARAPFYKESGVAPLKKSGLDAISSGQNIRSDGKLDDNVYDDFQNNIATCYSERSSKIRKRNRESPDIFSSPMILFDITRSLGRQKAPPVSANVPFISRRSRSSSIPWSLRLTHVETSPKRGDSAVKLTSLTTNGYESSLNSDGPAEETNSATRADSSHGEFRGHDLRGSSPVLLGASPPAAQSSPPDNEPEMTEHALRCRAVGPVLVPILESQNCGRVILRPTEYSTELSTTKTPAAPTTYSRHAAPLYEQKIQLKKILSDVIQSWNELANAFFDLAPETMKGSFNSVFPAEDATNSIPSKELHENIVKHIEFVQVERTTHSLSFLKALYESVKSVESTLLVVNNAGSEQQQQTFASLASELKRREILLLKQLERLFREACEVFALRTHATVFHNGSPGLLDQGESLGSLPNVSFEKWKSESFVEELRFESVRLRQSPSNFASRSTSKHFASKTRSPLSRTTSTASSGAFVDESAENNHFEFLTVSAAKTTFTYRRVQVLLEHFDAAYKALPDFKLQPNA